MGASEGGFGLALAGAKNYAEEGMMESRFDLPGNCGKRARSHTAMAGAVPPSVRESLMARNGEYDARRLRSQREVIRDVMLAAADCGTWLTLGELRALTRYGEASISAQLRHLRKMENGGYEVVKRHRDGATPAHPGTDGRGEFVWEYRVERAARCETKSAHAEMSA